MMKRFILLTCSLACTGFFVLAQDTDSQSLRQKARTFAGQGDYTNAIIVLTGAIKKDPKNLELQKDLAFDYYLQTEFAKGLNVARPLVERPDADVQCYQLTAMLLKAVEDLKECERLYKSGLKRFPRSGPLHSEYGEMLWSKQDYSAIREWEKGIEVDPNYAGNYFNASRYYFTNNDKVWSLIYGEIFINLESYSKRTIAMKDLLLEGYKKLFVDDADGKKKQEEKSGFAAAFQDIMNRNAGMISQGLTAPSLTALRTKFIMTWFDQYATTYPFRLFDYQRQLIKDGMFDAYNQWVFGAAESKSGFQEWTKDHADAYDKWTQFQKGRVFKMPEGQYYQKLK